MGARDGSNAACIWTGELDEIRFRAESSSDEWISTEYASETDPDFLTFGEIKCNGGFFILVR